MDPRSPGPAHNPMITMGTVLGRPTSDDGQEVGGNGRTRGSGPSAPWSDRYFSSMELTADSRGVDVECLADRGEGVASEVATGGCGDVGIAHLPPVHPSLDAACLQVSGDCLLVDSALAGEVGQRLACEACVDQIVDLGLRQAALNRPAARV